MMLMYIASWITTGVQVRGPHGLGVKGQVFVRGVESETLGQRPTIRLAVP
jgi:hypothetical protein